MSVSISDEPNGIFGLFEFGLLVDRFEQQCAAQSRQSTEVQEDGLIVIGERSTEVEQVETAEEESAGQDVEGRSSKPDVEEPVVIDEPTLVKYLDLLSRELVPDDELSRLPGDAIKDVFPFFMKANFQMPDIDFTPLGGFLLKKKDEQIEDLTTFELEQMLSFTLKENKMLKIQSDVFTRFLKKNDPRYSNDDLSNRETEAEKEEDIDGEEEEEEAALDISTAEMIRSTVIFPVADEYDSEDVYRTVLGLYTRVVEHEIKSVHKEYEVELNKFNTKMKDLSSIKNASNLHRDKIRETSALLKGVIVKKQKKKRRKFIFDPLHFAEFLKAAIKQDQQDLRRFNVMIYEHKKKMAAIEKEMNSSTAVRRVDLELYEIKAKQLSTKLSELNDEFLQLKKIFDSYQVRVDKFQKRLEANRKMLLRNQKAHAKKVRDLRVQFTCYKMAFESMMTVIDFIERLHAVVLQRKDEKIQQKLNGNLR